MTAPRTVPTRRRWTGEVVAGVTLGVLAALAVGLLLVIARGPGTPAAGPSAAVHEMALVDSYVADLLERASDEAEREEGAGQPPPVAAVSPGVDAPQPPEAPPTAEPVLPTGPTESSVFVEADSPPELWGQAPPAATGGLLPTAESSVLVDPGADILVEMDATGDPPPDLHRGSSWSPPPPSAPVARRRNLRDMQRRYADIDARLARLLD